MADATTVPTPPASRKPHELDHDYVIPISYTVSAAHPTLGVEISVHPGDREAPPCKGDKSSSFFLRLHTDGSPCPGSCSCVTAEDRTRLYHHQTVVIGEWTWSASCSWAVGWHRTGPNAAERFLEARVDELEEEIAQEQILHGLTREDVAAGEADIEALKTRRKALVRQATQYRYDRMRLRRRLTTVHAVAGAGWGAALALALVLILTEVVG